MRTNYETLLEFTKAFPAPDSASTNEILSDVFLYIDKNFPPEVDCSYENQMAYHRAHKINDGAELLRQISQIDPPLFNDSVYPAVVVRYLVYFAVAETCHIRDDKNQLPAYFSNFNSRYGDLIVLK